MKNEVEKWEYKNIAFIVGNTQDRKTLTRAMMGSNIVIHTAAMKQIPLCEDNPIEAKQNNVDGAQNVIEAALMNVSVERVMNISTDKAAYPINLYGMTKATAEKMFNYGNVYSQGQGRRPFFASCRYGNVMGSKGSVIQLFKEQSAKKVITITDPEMTRFWITLEKVVRFVIWAINAMEGGELFIPDMPSCKMINIANTVAPGCEHVITGIRKGEKKHENIFTEEESECSIYREFAGEDIRGVWIIKDGINRTKPFKHNSLDNPYVLTESMLLRWLKEDEAMRGIKWI
jgi:FlaA1/EpsC-like NDP-sugar epimerase